MHSAGHRQTRISRIMLCGVTLLVLALAACDWRTPGATAGPSAAPQAAPKDAAAENKNGVTLPEASLGFITVEAVSEGIFSSGGTVPARLAIQPQALAAVGAPLGGRVISVLVRPGDRVKAGTPLVRIQSGDAAALRATLESAAARAASAEESLKRQNEMMAKGVGLEFERLEAESRVREARAELQRARRPNALLGADDGDIVNVRAPISGLVMTVKTAAGAMVAPGGDALVEVADPSRLWAVADVVESEAQAVQIGQRVSVLVPGAQKKIEGKVEGLGSQVDAETRRLPVYVSLGGNVAGLTPGMQAELRFMNPKENAITLPVQAVLIKNGKQRVVYVQRDDKRFDAREIKVGASAGGRVQVLEGLAKGERVVVKGALLLDSEAEQLL